MRSIKIGTRNSPLAMYQAEEVARQLQGRGVHTELIPITSTGDKNTHLPLYAMGITGVFTRDLDQALLNHTIDIAIHSLKDVPTQLPENLEIIACLKRDYNEDVLVRSSKAKHKPLEELKIATSSLRRRAFWSRKFPETEFVDIRGNVNTRLNKIENGLADATLFSLAGIKRLGLPIPYEVLDFMIPAPSQGVIAVVGSVHNEEIKSIVQQINHSSTEKCVNIERQFLKTLEGGCTAPIGAYAEMQQDTLKFKGRLCSIDGQQCIDIQEEELYNATKKYGEIWAQNVLSQGGKNIMEEIKKSL